MTRSKYARERQARMFRDRPDPGITLSRKDWHFSTNRASLLRQAECAIVTATINKVGETIPLLEQRVEVRKYLFDEELGSKLL
jgi:hypothetical protein